MSPDEIVIPAPIRHVFWKQILKGDFLDAIYDCPFEMHELVTDEDISKAIFTLKDVQKELLSATILGYPARLSPCPNRLTETSAKSETPC